MRKFYLLNSFKRRVARYTGDLCSAAFHFSSNEVVFYFILNGMDLVLDQLDRRVVLKVLWQSLLSDLYQRDLFPKTLFFLFKLVLELINNLWSKPYFLVEALDNTL